MHAQIGMVEEWTSSCRSYEISSFYGCNLMGLFSICNGLFGNQCHCQSVSREGSLPGRLEMQSSGDCRGQSFYVRASMEYFP